MLLALATLTGCVRALPPTMLPADELSWHSDDGWTGTVRHFPGPGEPVLLVHGMGGNHYNFDYRPEVSLARALQDDGWDVWIPNLRGDPDTAGPDRKAERSFTFDDFALRDMPAIVDAVLERTGRQQLYWVGHSMGGMLLYTALAEYPERVAAGVAISSPVQIQHPEWTHKAVRRTGFAMVGEGKVHTRVLSAPLMPLGRFNPLLGVLSARGSLDLATAKGLARHALVDLPRATNRQTVAWIKSGQLVRADGVTPWVVAPEPPVPLLVMGGSADLVAPQADVLAACDVYAECTAVDLGPWGHLDPVLGTRAQAEVYPLVVRWLGEQRDRASGG